MKVLVFNKTMIKFLIITFCLVIIMLAFAYEKHYIKENKGNTTGYTKTYSNGVTKQYNSKGQLEYTYKKFSNGLVTKYSKSGRKLEVYK